MASATDQRHGTAYSTHLKIEFSYLISGSICFPFASVALDTFIVARNDAIKIQADEWTRCLPGQILRGSLMLSRDSNGEISRTYSATKPKRVVFGITALCRLLIYRFQVPLWPESIGVFEKRFVSQDIPVFTVTR